MNTTSEELASLYVLDQLNEEDRRLFENRLETDAELQHLVRELETVFEGQIRALPQHKVPDYLLFNILQRIHTGSGSPVRPSVFSQPWLAFGGWGLAALLLLGLGLSTVFNNRNPVTTPADRQPGILVVGMNPQSSIVETIPAVMPVDQAESFVHLAKMAESYWQHPDSLPGKIDRSPLANTLGRGYAVFDPQSKSGYVAIQKLPPRREGKNYLLWLKDSDSNVLACAGIIPLREKDQGLYFFELGHQSPINSNRVTFFITEEDATDKEPTRPRGELVLGSDRI